jgi:hypothetical protein
MKRLVSGMTMQCQKLDHGLLNSYLERLSGDVRKAACKGVRRLGAKVEGT